MTGRFFLTSALAVSLAILFVASAAQSAGTDKFSATVAPSAVQPSSSGTFMIRITNRPTSTHSANNAHVDVQGGFTVDATSLAATTSAAGSCVAATWTASLNGTTIDAVSPGGTGDLCPGATLTLTLAATAPAAEGISEWTTSLNTDSTGFGLQGAQPTVAVDGTPPAAPTITSKPSDPANSPSPSFSFTDSEENVIFRCALDDGAATACTSPKAYTGVAEGQHTFSVAAVDAAGNQSTATSYTWTIDLTPPPPPTITSPAPAVNSASASFSFSDGEATAAFRCKLDSAAASACTSPTAYSSLSDGPHTFSVTALDAAGNESAATSVTWTIDTTPPPAPAITTSLPNVTASRSASFALSDSEAAVAYLCRLDTDAFAPCPTTVSYGSLAEGSHTFQAKASDAAGNESTVSSFTWTIDLTHPVVTIDPASEPPKLTNHASASFVFTSNKPNSTFACRLDGSAFSACTSPASYSGLASGKHSFSVRATDSVGNVGLPTTWEWTIDTVPPKTTITHAPAAVSSSPSATFEFTGSEPVAGFACSLDGGAFAACSSPKSYGGLADGQHTFRVRATDLAGNTEASPASYSWQVSTLLPPDTTPPGPVKNLKPKVAYGSLKLAWTLPTDLDLDDVQVMRTREPSGTGATRVYEGKGSGYADRHFQNGTWYRYAIRSYDHAGNASRRVTIDVKPGALLRSPADGAVVKAPPLLLWTAVAKTRYYNVQLYRGRKKVMSSWPVRARLQLKRRWRYQTYPFRLRAGTYRWYVWPAFGSASKPTFGQLIGTGTFVVR